MLTNNFTTKNPFLDPSKNLVFAVVFILLSSIIEPASGSTVTFEFGGKLTQVGGPNSLAVGDLFK